LLHRQPTQPGLRAYVDSIRIDVSHLPIHNGTALGKVGGEGWVTEAHLAGYDESGVIVIGKVVWVAGGTATKINPVAVRSRPIPVPVACIGRGVIRRPANDYLLGIRRPKAPKIVAALIIAGHIVTVGAGNGHIAHGVKSIMHRRPGYRVGSIADGAIPDIFSVMLEDFDLIKAGGDHVTTVIKAIPNSGIGAGGITHLAP